MLVSFFARGTGGGSGPVDYVTAEKVVKRDPQTGLRIKGEFIIRDPVPVVMAGDPDLTRWLIDSSENKWKYTSGVISFERGDAPTETEQREVMAGFEALAFAGLDQDRYNVLWVKHTHCGNVELHFVVPRLELSTGKAFNMAPPGYEKAFDAFRDAWNFRKGWADPNDPTRTRILGQDAHRAKLNAASVRAGLAVAPDPKKLLTDYLVQRIEAGALVDRAGIVSALAEIGQVFAPVEF